MRLRHLLFITVVLLVVLLAGCSGGGAPQSGGVAIPQFDLVPATAEDGIAADPNRETSAAFVKFFSDTVNEQSNGRWTVTNTTGYKQWVLTNPAQSAPKAWYIGGNYWNNENDTLTTNAFTVPDGTVDVRLAFWSRWQIAANDFGYVEYSINGGAFQNVATYTGGSSPGFAGWHKYYYVLPDNISGSDQTWKIRYRFTSDGSGVAWGFGVDEVSVYQTQLNAPINVDASDGGLPGEVVINWSHNNAGNLIPDGYDIYRAPDNGNTPGSYSFLANVAYPGTAASDINGTGDQYWYKVKAIKANHPDSPDSNEDDGHGDGTWQTNTAENFADVGYYASLALNGAGKPAISHYDNNTGDLRYSYSSTVDGSGSWTTVLVDGAAINAGDFYPTLALVNGKPAISYWDATNQDLRYAFSSQADGSSGWSNIQVDGATSNCGQYSFLAVVNGKPAISYYDDVANLRYAYSSSVDGALAGDWTKVTADGTVSSVYTSLAVINGKPAISYFDGSNGDLEFAHSSQVDGSSGWSSVTVDSAGSVGTYTSLALINGKPAISYYDNSNQNLKYAYSSSVDGALAGDWAPVIVDSTGDVGQYSSLAVIYGKPAISYYDSTNGDLKYAISTQDNGSSGWNPISVDTTGFVGEYTSILQIDGGPAIGYRDASNTNLKFAWLQ